MDEALTTERMEQALKAHGYTIEATGVGWVVNDPLGGEEAFRLAGVSKDDVIQEAYEHQISDAILTEEPAPVKEVPSLTTLQATARRTTLLKSLGFSIVMADGQWIVSDPSDEDGFRLSGEDKATVVNESFNHLIQECGVETAQVGTTPEVAELRRALDTERQLRIAAETQRDALAGYVDKVKSVINESEGVAGYHLNGAIASWEELELEDIPEQALAPSW
jgi:vacuolar-type H+-ATPase subunit F/Vma7